MISKKLIFFSLLFLLVSFNTQSYSQQRIKDFYLSNFKEDGSQDWEVEGREATIYDKYVDIDQMKANYHLNDDTVVITSDEARLDKESMDVYLKKNVVVKNKEGATLFTESLNWQRQNNKVDTQDWVKANKDSMQINAKGLSADTELKNADFKEDVEVTLPAEEGRGAITVTCVGPLEIEYNTGKAVFNKDVVVSNEQGKLFSDKATIYFDNQQNKVEKIVSQGHVKIVRDGNVTYSQKATYLADEQRIVLEGKPRLIYFPEEDQDTGFLN